MHTDFFDVVIITGIESDGLRNISFLSTDKIVAGESMAMLGGVR